MRVGTKSLLFGVHAIWYHGFTVAAAWGLCYGRWPRDAAEWLAIFCHDLGYWGSQDMDGEEGLEHPARSADLVMRMWFIPFSVRVKAWVLILGHSESYARRTGRQLSTLHKPDKLSIFLELKTFYLFRAWLSGEIWEYMENSPHQDLSGWFDWYKKGVIRRFGL